MNVITYPYPNLKSSMLVNKGGSSRFLRKRGHLHVKVSPGISWL